MKKSLVLLSMLGVATTCHPMERMFDSKYLIYLFSYPELVAYAGRYASYGDATKKRGLAIAPVWSAGALVGFTANLFPVENKTLLTANIAGVATLASAAATVRAFGGADVADALGKLHGTNEKEVILALAAGYVMGGLAGRATNKSCRFAGAVFRDGAYYGYQGAKGIGKLSWRALVAAFDALKRKLNQPEQPNDEHAVVPAAGNPQQ